MKTCFNKTIGYDSMADKLFAQYEKTVMRKYEAANIAGSKLRKFGELLYSDEVIYITVNFCGFFYSKV